MSVTPWVPWLGCPVCRYDRSEVLHSWSVTIHRLYLTYRNVKTRAEHVRSPGRVHEDEGKVSSNQPVYSDNCRVVCVRAPPESPELAPMVRRLPAATHALRRRWTRPKSHAGTPTWTSRRSPPPTPSTCTPCVPLREQGRGRQRSLDSAQGGGPSGRRGGSARCPWISPDRQIYPCPTPTPTVRAAGRGVPQLSRLRP